MIKKSTLTKPKKPQLVSPKQSSVNFLLSFAAAYHVAKTDGTTPICDFILN